MYLSQKAAFLKKKCGFKIASKFSSRGSCGIGAVYISRNSIKKIYTIHHNSVLSPNTSRSFFTIARFHHNTCCLIIYCNNTFTVQLVLPALQYPHTIHYTSMYLYMCVICPWTRTYTRTHTYIPTHIYCTFSYNIVLVLNCYNIVSYNYLTLLIYVGNNRYLVCT